MYFRQRCASKMMNRPCGDADPVAARAEVQASGHRWQPTWWSTRPAPRPNWLERLELGIPLPRQLRR